MIYYMDILSLYIIIYVYIKNYDNYMDTSYIYI